MKHYIYNPNSKQILGGFARCPLAQTELTKAESRTPDEQNRIQVSGTMIPKGDLKHLLIIDEVEFKKTKTKPCLD